MALRKPRVAGGTERRGRFTEPRPAGSHRLPAPLRCIQREKSFSGKAGRTRWETAVNLYICVIRAERKFPRTACLLGHPEVPEHKDLWASRGCCSQLSSKSLPKLAMDIQVPRLEADPTRTRFDLQSHRHTPRMGGGGGPAVHLRDRTRRWLWLCGLRWELKPNSGHKHGGLILRLIWSPRPGRP